MLIVSGLVKDEKHSRIYILQLWHEIDLVFYHLVSSAYNWWIWLIIGVGAAVAISLIFYLCCTLRRKDKAEGNFDMINFKHGIIIFKDFLIVLLLYQITREWKNEPSNEYRKGGQGK